MKNPRLFLKLLMEFLIPIRNDTRLGKVGSAMVTGLLIVGLSYMAIAGMDIDEIREVVCEPCECSCEQVEPVSDITEVSLPIPIDVTEPTPEVSP